ncbi:MAG: hypothetical protein V4676_12915 [Bacteroidota bacterium]
MQHKSLSTTIKLVRNSAFLVLLSVAIITLFSNHTKKMADVFWQQLGISQIKGTQNIKESFTSGYLYYYGAANAKNITAGNRAAVTKDLLDYAKTFLTSQAFADEYQKLRSSAKPIQHDRQIKSKEELRKQKIAETEKSIAETEKMIKTMSADVAKNMTPLLEVFKSNLKEYRNPNSEMIEMMYQGELMNKTNHDNSYNAKMITWEKEFPALPQQLIKQRLKYFIDLAATVNFNAALKTVGDKKKFVQAEYEGKPTDWKQIFRAGREVVEPAVAFAKQWLAEIK